MNQKLCPNCNSETNDNYCAHCGQPTHLHDDTFWNLISHFAGHYFHFDSKLWRSIRTLVTKPGALTLAWKNKQRMRFVDPIGLYIFVSIVFFILVSFTVRFSQKTTQNGSKGHIQYAWAFGASGLNYVEEVGEKQWVTFIDSTDSMKYGWIDAYETADKEYPMSKLPKEIKKLSHNLTHGSVVYVVYNYFVFKYAAKHKIINFDQAMIEVVEKFLHLVPKVFFILMPIMALLLLSVFFRKKEFKFADHGVMSLHAHSFLFISCSVQLMIGSFINFTDNKWLLIFYVIIPCIYFCISLRRFYQVSWLRAILTGTLTWSLYLVIVFITSIVTFLALFLYL